MQYPSGSLEVEIDVFVVWPELAVLRYVFHRSSRRRH